MKQSLLYFVVAAMCALSAITSTLIGRISSWTILVIALTGIVLGLGLKSRNAGN